MKIRLLKKGEKQKIAGPSCKLMHGDCLKRMKEIPDQSVDLILADPPYGTTACSWDSVIPLEPMWKQLKRIIKPNGAIVMTASQPFTTTLIASNIKMFKYCWVWQKSKATGFQDAKNRPLKGHEDIIVFSQAGCSTGSRLRMNYYPQGLVLCHRTRTEKKAGGFFRSDCRGGGVQTETNYPLSVLIFKSEGRSAHPTQKPVALMKYLIKTYTVEGEKVLDFTMGSGTTGVACAQTGRAFIGIELDPTYFDQAKFRINAARRKKYGVVK